jgi:hypothetical protein
MNANRESHDKARSEMKAKYASSSYHAGDSSQMAKAALEHCKAIKDIGGAGTEEKAAPEDQAAILADVLAEVELLEQVLAEHVADTATGAAVHAEPDGDEAPAVPPPADKGLGQESPLNPSEAVKPAGPPAEKALGPPPVGPPIGGGGPGGIASPPAAGGGGEAAGAGGGGAAGMGMAPGGGNNLHEQAAAEHKAMAEEHAEGSAEKAYHLKAAALHEGVAKEGDSVEMTKTAPADGTAVKTAPADGTSVTKEGDNIEMTKALAEANKIIKSMETRLAKVEAQPDYANAPARFMSAMTDGLEDPDQIIKNMQPRDRDAVSRSVLSSAFEGIIGKAMGKRR